MLFQDLGKRKVVGDFSGGRLSSDGGVLLLRQIDAGMGIIRTVSRAFRDDRNPDLIEHSVEELLRQRIFGLALGYEDLNDHEQLRRDPLIAAAVGKEDLLGEARRLEKDRGFAMASAATLNRLELGAQHADRYRKLHADPQKLENIVLELGVRALPKHSKLLVLDFDATDDPLHGSQEGRFFHGYYGNYCYLPLYCFCGAVPLWSQLRMSDHDASTGTVEALTKIVKALRQRMPGVIIVVRADSGFAREPIMAWCESQSDVYYLIGVARNSRLEQILEPAMDKAKIRHCLTGGVACREFMEVEYQTQKSWSRSRRLLGKAEVLGGNKANPRFVVTNIPAAGILSQDKRVLMAGEVSSLYEQEYCGRGEAENMIKQMTLDLHADRTSTHWMASNQMRLWFSTLAYLLLERLQTLGLAGTVLAKVTLGTLRLKLLKVAALVEVSVRRVHVALCSAFPLQEVFRLAVLRVNPQALETGG
jgi:TusA-related sulfurtransferase